MAITLDNGSTEGLFRSLSIGKPYTISWWVHFNALTNGHSGGWSTNNSGQIAIFSSKLFWYGPGFYQSSTLSTNTWYHVACVSSGSTTEIFLNGASDGTGGTGTPGSVLALGYYRSKNFRMEAFKVWQAALSLAEIQQEQWFNRPRRTENLLVWSPFVAPDSVNFRDYSGNGNNWTEYGTVDGGTPGPPITYSAGSPVLVIEEAAAPGGGQPTMRRWSHMPHVGGGGTRFGNRGF